MRLRELDSLRGLAALAVSLGHALYLPLGAGSAVLALLAITPLHALWDGNRAVVFFFVLSGFVLAVPFFRGNVSPTAFEIKRAVRIYPAYWFGMVPAIAIYALAMDPHLTLDTLIKCVVLVDASGVAQTYNGVVWSLVHEMRLSILFPLIMVPTLRFRSRWVLLGSMPLLSAGLWGIGPEAGPTATVFYAWFFVIGAIAAKHIDEMVAYARAMNTRRSALWLGVALCIYGGLPIVGITAPFEEAAMGASTIGFMVLGLARPGLSRLLLSPALRFVGRIAYSYYLLHTLAIEALVHFAHGAPNLVIGCGAIAISLLVAWLVYRWVEVPSIKLGQALYVRITAHMNRNHEEEGMTWAPQMTLVVP